MGTLFNVDNNGQVTINNGLKVVDGNQAVGKVLTSDSAGLSSWATSNKIGQPTLTVTVGADKCDYVTLAAAIVGLGTPLSLTTIYIQPGSYTETPVTIPNRVNIVGIGKPTLNYNNATPALTLSPQTRRDISGIHVINAGGNVLDVPTGTGENWIWGCVFQATGADKVLVMSATGAETYLFTTVLWTNTGTAIQNLGTHQLILDTVSIYTATTGDAIVMGGGSTHIFGNLAIDRYGAGAGYCISATGATVVAGANLSFNTGSSSRPLDSNITIFSTSYSAVGRVIIGGAPTTGQVLIASDTKNAIWGTRQEGVVPTGNIDGGNNVFTLPATPIPASTSSAVKVFSDGIRVNPNQYTISGTTLTFNVGSINIPVDDLTVDYIS